MDSRAVQLLGRMVSLPNASLPKGCHGWAEPQAAYLFFANSKVSGDKVLAPIEMRPRRAWQAMTPSCASRALQAQLGGFPGRKSDGEPGPKTLWIGLQRARDFVLALDAYNVVQGPAPDTCM